MDFERFFPNYTVKSISSPISSSLSQLLSYKFSKQRQFLTLNLTRPYRMDFREAFKNSR